MNWCMQRALNRPTAQDAPTNDVAVETCTFRCGHQRLARAQDVVVGTISLLFTPSSPPYVPRLVMALIVRPAVKAMAYRGPRPDVGGKRLEGVAPALADGDALRAIALVIPRALRVVAPLNHACPYFVEIGATHAVRRQALAGPLSPHAPATDGRTVPEIVGPHDSGLPAITPTCPPDDAYLQRRRSGHDRQVAESLPREIHSDASHYAQLYSELAT